MHAMLLELDDLLEFDAVPTAAIRPSDSDLDTERDRLSKVLGAEPAVGLAAWSCFARRWLDARIAPMVMALVPAEGYQHDDLVEFRTKAPADDPGRALVATNADGGADLLHIGRDPGGLLFVVSPAIHLEAEPPRVAQFGWGESSFHVADNDAARPLRPSCDRTFRRSATG